jgi:hypothetical protein
MFSRIFSTARNLLYSDPVNEEDNQQQLSPAQTAEDDQSKLRSPSRYFVTRALEQSSLGAFVNYFLPFKRMTFVIQLLIVNSGHNTQTGRKACKREFG